MEVRRRKKVALVLSGAASLGSFEAGVACELIKHLQENPNPIFDIDVIAGASAGALTGALMALLLTKGGDPEILKEAWLSVQIDDLFNLNKGERSLLSGQKLESIIAKYCCPSAIKTRPCNKMKQVNLAVVVTNLDGVIYKIQTAKERQFDISAIGYEDTVKFVIDEQFNNWDKLRDAVRASSAFPVAFEHKKLLRERMDYMRRAGSNFTRKNVRHFNCSDGGIVNNEPLNIAMDIVNNMPENCHSMGYERVFLVVDPLTADMSLDNDKKYSVFDVATKALWTIPRNQTLYKDLLVLEKINRRVIWKNTLVSFLAGAVSSKKNSKTNHAEIERLCNEIAAFKGHTVLGLRPDEYLSLERTRLANTYKEYLGTVGNRELFLKYCFLLEQVADLRNKYEVSVEMIKPQDAEKELSGVIFGSFGGFLSPDFMRHDFEVGRYYAKSWLNEERAVQSLMQLKTEELSPKVQKRVLQRVFDNSIPLLVEEIGPKVFGGDGLHLSTGIKAITITGMVIKSVFKYTGRRIKEWSKALWRK